MTPDDFANRFDDLVTAAERIAAAVEKLAADTLDGPDFVAAITRVNDSLDRMLLALRDR